MNKKMLIVLFVAISIVVFAVSIFLGSRFRVLNVAPSLNKSVPTSTAAITITFNKPLDPGSITVEKINQNKTFISSFNIKDSVLTLYINRLVENESYEFTIKNIRSVGGDEISELRYSFVAVYVPLSELSEDELANQISTTSRKSGPPTLYDVLPYETMNYRISFEPAADNQATIFIDMKFSSSTTSGEIYESYKQQIRTYRNQALSYLKNNGIDINNYAIEYGEEELRSEFPSGRAIQEEYTGDGVPPELQ